MGLVHALVMGTSGGGSGTQGPQGEPGPQGIPGPQGDPGSPGIGLFSFLHPTGTFYTQALNATAFSTIAGAVNRIDLAPFVPAVDFTCDQLAVNVTTLISGALGKIIVYSADASGRPNAPLFESGNLDFGSTGVKTAAVNLSLVAGQPYWFGVRHSATATLRGIPLGSLTPLGIGAATSTTPFTSLRRTLAFATAAPNPWGFSAAELQAVIHPVIFMRTT